MTVPLRLSFHDVSHSDGLVDFARRQAERIGVLRTPIDCHLTLERPDGHHRQGYRARVDVSLPGHAIVGTHVSTDNETMADAYLAVGGAFEHARRQLLDHIHRRRDAARARAVA